MPSPLPLKVRVDIRDIWNAKDNDLRIAVEDLTKTLGYTIEPEVEWPALWTSTSAGFPENKMFVSSIVRLTVTWYRQLAGRIERDAEREWNEKLLEHLKEARNDLTNVLWIQPSTSSENIVKSRWDQESGKFYMDVPKNINPQMSDVEYDFERDFDGFFSTEPAPEDLPDAGDWADVVVETQKASGPLSAAPIAKPVRMPSVETTPRPSDLLKTLTPHYLIFNSTTFPAYIQCSYEPTLKYLADYLKRHGKTNTNDSQRRHMYKVELEDSNFCHSLRDTLTIDLHMKGYHREHNFNPTLILSLIEGVLGYKRVDDGYGCWIFRHETGFI